VYNPDEVYYLEYYVHASQIFCFYNRMNEKKCTGANVVLLLRLKLDLTAPIKNAVDASKREYRISSEATI
jgi:hypothetical protein